EVELLNTMLTIGEYATLTQAVTELSGLDEDINDLIEDAKN
ncbi:MAG: phage portal protein, partial [Oligella ureolytica]|nr:phage portal protein [Oligella ureolytica]